MNSRSPAGALRAAVGYLDSPKRKGAIVGMTCNAVSASIGFVFVPEYLRQLGGDGVAYVGLLTSLLALASVADFGLGSAVSLRIASAAEPAKLSDQESAGVRRLVLWTLVIAAGVAATGFIARDSLASWLFPNECRAHESASLIAALTGLCLASRLAESVARVGMVAAGHQARSAMFAASFVVLRVAGAAVLLRATGMGLLGFVAWNALILCASASNAVAQLTLLSKPYPSRTVAEPRLPRVARYAAASFAASLLSVLATQMDRVYLQGRISESEMAAYCIAASVLSVRGMLVGPMLQAFTPSMTRHLSLHGRDAARGHFDRFSDVQASVLLPPLLIVLMMPERFLFAWTGNADISAQGAASLRLLSIAAALNALSAIPHALELAAGRSSQGLRFAACACVTSWLSLVLLSDRLGAVAGGVAHVVAYAMYLTVFAPRVLSSHLGRSVWAWVLGATWFPASVSILAGTLASLWIGGSDSRLGSLFQVVVPIVAAWTACIAVLVRRFHPRRARGDPPDRESQTC